MTFTNIIKDIFTKTPKAAKDNSANGGVKAFMSKLSGAFMLPISVMAVAGLFLGVGAAIDSHTSAKTFGAFIKALGDPVFGAMPALFMIAIIIAFTEEAGVAVFAGIVAFLVFNAIQSPFIETSGNGQTGMATFLGINTSDNISGKMYKIAGSFWGLKSLNTSIFGGIVVGFIMSYIYNKFHQIELPSAIAFFGGKRFVAFAGIIAMIPMAFAFLLIWPWIGLGLAYFGEYSGKVSGLDSFIFGFVERSLIPFGLHHVFYAPLWWTSAGGDIQSQFGDWAQNGQITDINNGAISTLTENTATLKNSLTTLINDHTSGNLTWDPTTISGLSTVTFSNGVVTVTGSEANISADISKVASEVRTQLASAKTNEIKVLADFASIISISDLNEAFISKITANGTAQGDSFGWLAVNGSSINEVTFSKGSTVSKTMKVFPFIKDQLGISLGRFMQGKFAFMQLGLPAAGAAMIMAAPKENRKDAFAIVFPASLTSFVTGVTEPIEFTFLFLAPVLFWGFHATMAAFSFLFMNLFGAHVGMTFSGGIIDTIIYGAIPFSQGTNFFWMYVIGVVYAPIYFFVFLWWIKKFNLETPGRGGNAKLFTKADYKEKNAGVKGGLNPQANAIVSAFGGWDNITKFANCATRLRYNVKDQSKVDQAALKGAGAVGVVLVGKNHVQAIIGPKAEQLNSNIRANKGVDLVSANKTMFKKSKSKTKETVSKTVDVNSVASGTVATLASLKDGVFSEKMMGDGIVVKFPASTKKGSVYAPVSGKLVTVFPTGHAYGIKTKEGIEVLVHIGVDTVNLNGKGFKALVKQDKSVKAGDKLAEVDVTAVRKAAPSADPIVLITSGQKVSNKAKGKVTKESKLFSIV